MNSNIIDLLSNLEEVSLYSLSDDFVIELDSRDCKLILDYINNLKEQNKIFEYKSIFYRNLYLVLNDIYRERFYE